MTTPLLVLTSDLPFGELLRQSLEETGRFNVRVTAEIDTAIGFVSESACPLAFIDLGPDESQAVQAGLALRRANSRIRIVLLSEKGQQPVSEELRPDEQLSKPFYLPDLLDMMDKFFRPNKQVETPPEAVEAAPPWLSDVTRAAQHLTSLTLGSSAQAALITQEGRLWAYAGQFPQSSAKELADTVVRYWDQNEQNDVIRFIRLSSTKAEHMLYATRLVDGMVLALTFDAETPFSTIRSQASQLVHSLCKSPYMESPGDELEGGISPDMTPLGDILSNVPPPNPLAGNEIRNMPAFRLSATERPDLETYSDPAGDPQPQIDPTRFETNIPAGSLDQTVESLTVTRKSKSRRPEVDPLDETRPRPIVEFARKMVLEPTAAGLYNLDYACLLIPRFNHHHLTGDLSDRISEYVPQICIAFAWRLEYISVRPEYLQWIANVPPATSPAYLMRILRQHTSDKIFAEFPQYKKDNPSGDFWAPGYLIMGGSQPPPAQLIKDYINQTRVRQGIYQPTK